MRAELADPPIPHESHRQKEQMDIETFAPRNETYQESCEAEHERQAGTQRRAHQAKKHSEQSAGVTISGFAFLVIPHGASKCPNRNQHGRNDEKQSRFNSEKQYGRRKKRERKENPRNGTMARES